MSIRSHVLSLAFSLSAFVTHGQAFVELNYAGSNARGISLNAGYEFKLSADSTHLLSASFGLGTNLYPIATALGIGQGVLRYHYQRFGIGVACSAFTDNPLSGRYYYLRPNPHVSVVPHISYDLRLWSDRFYARVLCGPYLSYARDVKHPFQRRNPLTFRGIHRIALGISFCMRL
jgi:hypothetical protein